MLAQNSSPPGSGLRPRGLPTHTLYSQTPPALRATSPNLEEELIANGSPPETGGVPRSGEGVCQKR